MKVIRADKAGFCFGVKRALDIAMKTARTSPTASLGPLIHNQQVVDRLAEIGIQVVNSVQEARNGQTLVIRSHGVPPQIYEEAEQHSIQIADATCPFVQKAQRLAAESSKAGRQVVVIGDKEHPEVKGILGWAGKGAFAIESLSEAKELPHYSRLAVLAQTTQPTARFQEIVEELRSHTDDLVVHNTICHATEERQKAARELAQRVDVMIVVGGRNSANTRKLATICEEFTPTHLIETAEELQEIWFEGAAVAGLTAGASTPDWIIEEVYRRMTEINQKEALNEVIPETAPTNPETNDMDMASWDQGLQDLHRGALVTGRVVKVTGEEVFVDIGWKSEGVIHLNELAAVPPERPEDVVSLGDEVTAVVLRVENEEGHPVLSKRRADAERAIERLERLAQTKEEIQAKALEAVKGGLIVDVGLRGFVPASHIQLGYVEDLNQYVGKTLRLRVIEFDPEKRKVVLSQKEILKEEQERKRTHLLETLKEGDVVSGTVRRLTNFGAFIDLGGLDGLLHISEMAYSRIKHPSEILQVGDEVKVQVLNVDKEQGKISLSLKQLKPSPWENVEEKYPVGSIVTGKVVRIAPFGAFVQLEDGVDALIHISQLADRRVAKVEEVVNVGDTVSAKVIECSSEQKRISLSLKEALADSQNQEVQSLMENQPETEPVTIGEVVGQTTLEQDENSGE